MRYAFRMTTPLPEKPHSDSPAGRMRDDWDRRAIEDHKLHIATGHAGSEEAFLISGEKDLSELILDGIELQPLAEALEIGCGVGRLLIPLSKRVARARGVDISRVMIDKAQDYCAGIPNIAARVTEGGLDEFAESSLDFVYSFIVFQHVPDKAAVERYVRESHRILRPGGIFRFQVDGRWRSRAHRRADTYDGVVYSPDQLQALLAASKFELLEQWGEETHYHWITARKPPGELSKPIEGTRAGPNHARVSFRPRTYDEPLLARIFSNLDVPNPGEAARKIASGFSGIRSALGSFEDRFRSLPNREFVRRMFCGLLDRAPDEEGAAYHTKILDDGFEDRGALVDTILGGAEFRDLVRPRIPRVHWQRLLPIAELTNDAGIPGFFEALDLFESHFEQRPAGEFVSEVFPMILGHPADAEALAWHSSLIASRSQGRRFFLRLLFAVPEPAPNPGTVSNERIQALRDRIRVQAGSESRDWLIETFPGEADLARAVLREGRELDDRDFARLAHRRILGDEPDLEALGSSPRRIEDRQMSRARHLRGLFQSVTVRDSPS